MPSTRWRRLPACGTSWRFGAWPGASSRTRTPRRRRAGLLRKPGRGFFQDLLLFAQHPILASKPVQLPRSSVVSPSLRRPSSRSNCRTQFPIACAEGSNCRDSSSGVLPARTISTIRLRYSNGYGCDSRHRELLSRRGLLRPSGQVSTKPGLTPPRSPWPGWAELYRVERLDRRRSGVRLEERASKIVVWSTEGGTNGSTDLRGVLHGDWRSPSLPHRGSARDDLGPDPDRYRVVRRMHHSVAERRVPPARGRATRASTPLATQRTTRPSCAESPLPRSRGTPAFTAMWLFLQKLTGIPATENHALKSRGEE